MIKRQWREKPSLGTNLDYTHSLCPDYCWPFLGPQAIPQVLTRRYKPLNHGVSIYSGSQTWVPGRKYGYAVRHGADTDRIELVGPLEVNNVIPTGNSGFTILVTYRKTDTTLRASTGIGINGNLTSSDSMLLTLPYSDGNVYWRWGSVGPDDLTVSGLTFGDDIWVATTSPTGKQLWQNGMLRGSNTANVNRSSTSGWPYGFGSPAGFSNFADLADISLVMTWNRQLCAAEIREISLNPWQVFESHQIIGDSDAGIVVGVEQSYAFVDEIYLRN